MSTQEKQKKTKDGKTAEADLKAAARVNSAPGFGKARLTLKADGTWNADVQCINGDPRKKSATTLPNGISYFGGGRIPNPSDATVYLPDGVNIDTRYIFPWVPSDPDPLRLGGGIIKGEIIEGAQRQNPKPKDPIFAPFLMSEWANGAPYTEARVSIPSELGLTFYPGDQAFALIIADATGAYTAIAAAKKEGTCLDLPPA